MRHGFFVAALIWISASALVGQDIDRYDLYQLEASHPKFFQALSLQAEGKVGEAIDVFSEAIAENPNDFRAYCLRGFAWREKGNLDKALADGDHAVRVAPDDAGSYQFRAVILKELKKFDEAFADCNKAISLRPEVPSIYVTRSDVRPPGEIDQAIADLDKAIERSSDNKLIFIRRAVLFGVKGDLDRAVADFEEGLGMQVFNLQTNGALRPSRESKRAERESEDKLSSTTLIKRFDESIQKYPQVSAIHLMRGVVFAINYQDEKALADFDQALQLSPRMFLAMECRARIYSRKGEVGKAIDDASAMIGVLPNNALLFSHRAALYEKSKDFAKARSDFEQGMRVDPRNVEAQNALAWFLATCADEKFRDGPKAVDLATKACESGGWLIPSHLDTLAAACAESGDFQSAVKWETKAIELAPADKKREYRYRLVLFESGVKAR